MSKNKLRKDGERRFENTRKPTKVQEAKEVKGAARRSIDKQIYGLTRDGKLNPSGNGRKGN